MKKKLFLKFFVLAVIGAFVTFTSCKDYDDDINKLQDELNSLKTEMTSKINDAKSELNSTLTSEIATVNAAIDAAKDRLATAEGKLADLEAAQNATQAELDQAKADLEDAQAEIITLAARLGVLETFKEEATEELERLAEEAEDLEKRLAAVEGDYVTHQELEDAIENLETEINLLLGVINGRLNDLEAGLGSLEDAYNAFIGEYKGTAQDIIDQIVDAKTELGGRISVLEQLLGLTEEGKSTVIADIYEKLGTQLGLIEDNADAIEDLIADLAVEEGRIDSLYNDVIPALDKRVGVNETDIKALKTRMDDAEKDIKKIVEETIPELDQKLTGMINDVLNLLTNRLTSIALAPNLYIQGIEAIEFTTLNYGCMKDGDNAEPVTLQKDLVTSIGAPITANYKFNPRTFNLGNADYAYANRKAEVRSTSDLVSIVGEPKKVGSEVVFTLRRNNAHLNTVATTAAKQNFVQLEATLKGAALAEGETGVVIAAHQELVSDVIIVPSDIKIGDIKQDCGDDFVSYPYTFSAATDMTPLYEMEYNKIFNLREHALACFGLTGYEMEAFNLDFRFDMPLSKYYIDSEDTTTDQQKYFEVVDKVAGTFKAKDFNIESLGRTPIFKVELVDENGCVVRRAFVKVKVTVAKSKDIVVTQTKDLVYNCGDTKVTDFLFNEEYIRENIYRVITATTGSEVGMTHGQFWNTYNWENPLVTITKNTNGYGMTAPTIVSGTTSQGTATKKVVWGFTHGELGAIGTGGSTFVAELTVLNNDPDSAYPEKVTFRFVLNVTLPTHEFTKVENSTYWTKIDDEFVAFNSNINVPETEADTDTPPTYFETDLLDAYATIEANFEGKACTTHYYKIVNTYGNGKRHTTPAGAPAPLSGVELDGTIISLLKGDTEVEKALNSPLGLDAQIALVYVLESGDEIQVHDFMVHFIRPINLNLPVGKSLQDAKTGGDILSFDSNNLLTDWFGRPIISDVEVDVEECVGTWEYSPITTPVWVPPFQEVTTPANLVVEYETDSFVLTQNMQLYKAEATWVVEKREWGIVGYTPILGLPRFDWKDWTTHTTHNLETDWTVSEDAALLDLEALKLAIDVPANTVGVQYQLVQVGDTDVQEKTEVGVGQTITYTYITKFEYTSAVYTTHDGYWEDVVIDTPEPIFEGDTHGQREGNYVWTVICTPNTEIIPGQYWDFYEIDEITVDIAGITTNIVETNGQLPNGVTVVQEGNSIKYVNVGTPVSNSYLMYVPVTVTYGWGSVTEILTVTVLPSY